MDYREELKQQYKERTPVAGLYLIKNRQTGKVFLGSSMDLHGPLNRHRSELMFGSHRLSQLQQDWNEQGEKAFDFRILETVSGKNESQETVANRLAQREKYWWWKLNPQAPAGYNREAFVRRDP